MGKIQKESHHRVGPRLDIQAVQFSLELLGVLRNPAAQSGTCTPFSQLRQFFASLFRWPELRYLGCRSPVLESGILLGVTFRGCISHLGFSTRLQAGVFAGLFAHIRPTHSAPPLYSTLLLREICTKSVCQNQRIAEGRETNSSRQTSTIGRGPLGSDFGTGGIKSIWTVGIIRRSLSSCKQAR